MYYVCRSRKQRRGGDGESRGPSRENINRLITLFFVMQNDVLEGLGAKLPKAVAGAVTCLKDIVE